MTYRVLDCIKQATTSTGTGDLTLGATITGHPGLSSAVSSGDHFAYEVHAIDAGGVRAAQWETGFGQYFLDGATPKLRRLLVIDGSSGAETAVNFSAGTKHVSITALAVQAIPLRTSEQVTFYVRADGSNLNGGMVDSAGGAFATIEHAVAVATYITSDALIMVGAGSFGMVAPSQDGVLAVSGSGVGTTTITIAEATAGCDVSIDGCTIAGFSASYSARAIGNNARLSLDAVEFSANALGHICATSGGNVETADYTVSGGCSGGAHIKVDPLSRFSSFGTVTVSDDITLSSGWISIPQGAAIADFSGATFSLGGNTVTGTRYTVRGPGLIDTNGGGSTFLPGSTSGSASGGGEYL